MTGMNDAVILAWALAAMVGAGFVGSLIGEGLLSLFRWYGRRKGWIPQREIVFRMPMNCRAVRQDDDTIIFSARGNADERD